MAPDDVLFVARLISRFRPVFVERRIEARMKQAAKILDLRPETFVRFSPAVERPEPDEAETIRGLISTMRYINEKTLADGGHAIKSVHAKSHGILRGYLEVDVGSGCGLAG